MKDDDLLVEERERILSGKLDKLQTKMRGLGQRLEKAAGNMRSKGQLLPDDVLKGIGDVEREWKEICDAVQALAGEDIELSSLPPLKRSIPSARQFMKEAMEKQQLFFREEIRTFAVELLDDLGRIRHCDGPGQECMQQLNQFILDNRKLLEEFDRPPDELPVELMKLAYGNHPARDLLRMLSDPDSLDDETWATLEGNISETFGKSLRIAVSRGRLSLSATDELPDEVVRQSPRVGSPGAEVSAADSRAEEDPGSSAVADDLGENGVTSETEDSTSAGEQNQPVEEVESDDATEQELSIEEELEDEQSETADDAESVDGKRFRTKALTEIDCHVFGTGAINHANKVLWQLIDRENIGLAYHVARQCELSAGESAIPSPVLKALALLPVMNPLGGTVDEEVRAAIDKLYSYSVDLGGTATQEKRKAVMMLLFSAVAKPALIRSTRAVELLRAIETDAGSTALHDLRQAIIDYHDHALNLTPTLVKVLNRKLDWREETEKLRQGCGRWLEQKRKATLKYARATAVWRSWLDKSGVLEEMLSVVIENNLKRKDWLEKQLEEYAEEDRVKDLIIRTGQQQKGKAQPIEAGARRRLIRLFGEALSWPRHWLELHGEQGWGPDDFRVVQARKLRDSVLSARDAVKEMSVDGETDGPLLTTAVKILFRAMEDLATAFDEPFRDDAEIAWPGYLLNAKLLRADQIQLDNEWRIQEPAPDQLDTAVVQSIQRLNENWKAAFERHIDKQNFSAARHVLWIIENDQDSTNDAEILQKVWNDEIAAARASLKRQRESVRDLVARTLTDGLLAETEALEKQRQLEDLDVDGSLVLGPIENQLERIRKELGKLRSDQLDTLRQRFERLTREQDLPGETLERIQRIIEEEDVVLANELIPALEKNSDLPQPNNDAIDDFLEYFPKFSVAFSDFMAKPGAKQTLMENLNKGKGAGPVQLKGISLDQSRRSARMLRNWFEMKSSKKNSKRMEERRLIDFFKALGFEVSGVDRVRTNGKFSPPIFDLQLSPIEDRHLCPIPKYGSLARGNYRVIGIWDRLSEDETVELANRNRGARPLILLYFGRLAEQRHRDLARISRERKHDFICIDETLVGYLCSTREDPRRRLFQCVLPFTVAEPFTTVGGMPPPEMFFGRSRERAQVYDLQGTNLVYGGRQLGKTALLKDVVRRYHDPDNGVFVHYVDLKEQGIGLNRPPEDIWGVLVEAIGLPKTTTKKTFQKQVEEKLELDASSRILLLLDESDRFLDKDASQDYEQVLALKGLMEGTNRRFKVVFAGLHNVQRTSRDVNTPLAHLGTPVCIGPLLDGESREAVDLVRIPFEALGYRFENPTLPIRIAALANFYPSLIQIFCHSLISYLNDPHRVSFDPRKSPPYFITAQHIEDVYNHHELRRAILERFRWTLDLDNRYKIIALTIALAGIEQRGQGSLVDGFSLDWIREEAFSWWNTGFQETSSRESFATMLEEMIGLGVLVQPKSGFYTLRTPNVLNILGTRKEIEAALLDAADSDLALEYEASTFRRKLVDFEPWIRSPLTAEQEANILIREHGVALVFASPLSGLSLLVPALKQACRQGPSLVIDGSVSDGAAFEEVLSQAVEEQKHQIRDRNHKGEVFLVIVPPEAPWSVDWVVRATRKTHRLKISNFRVRVVFVGDLGASWRWQKDRDTLSSGSLHGEVRLHWAHPWHDAAIRRWMEDTFVGAGDSKESRKKIREMTGGWTALLHELGRHFARKAVTLNDLLQDFERRIPAIIKELGGLGLPGSAEIFLRRFRELEPVSKEDLEDLAELLAWTKDDVRRVIDWSDDARFVNHDENNLFLDSIVKCLLRPDLEG